MKKSYEYNPKTLLFEETNLNKRFKWLNRLNLILYLTIVLLCILSFNKDKVYLKKEVVVVEYNFNMERLNSLQVDSVYLYIKSLNLKFPEIVLSQSIQESGWKYDSSIAKENNNILGMRKAVKRPTVAIGERKGHAIFDNWRDCVKDYAIHQAYFHKELKTEQDYLNHLKNISYAEDTNYCRAVANILKIVKNKYNK